MAHSIPSNFRAFPIALALAAAASCWPTAAFAQSAPAETIQPAPSATTDRVRLTDEQRMAILDANTEESAAAARGELAGSQGLGRGIHGAFGVMIGSNGTRGVYGVAEIPLGDNGSATIAFESGRFGRRR